MAQQRRQPPRKPPARQGGARKAPARPAGGRPAAGRPAAAPEPKPFLTEDGSAFRHGVERRSAVVLVFLSRLPRALPGIIVIGLILAALVAPPVVSAAVLFVVAALLVWLVYLSWPSVPLPGRLVRLVVIAVVVAYAFVRLRAA
jgi:hypothetical protein